MKQLRIKGRCKHTDKFLGLVLLRTGYFRLCGECYFKVVVVYQRRFKSNKANTNQLA